MICCAARLIFLHFTEGACPLFLSHRRLTHLIYGYIVIYSTIYFYIRSEEGRKQVKTIVFANRKGGVAKSTCAAETYWSLTRSGYRVNYYDLDQQGGTLVETTEQPNADFSVVDARGEFTQDTVKLIADADVLCVPTKASRLEMPSLQLMIDAYKANHKKGARCVVILTMFTRFTNCRDFMEWLDSEIEGTGILTATLMQSEMFPQAAGEGKSVVAYAPRSSAASSTLAMANTIRKALRVKPESI